MDDIILDDEKYYIRNLINDCCIARVPKNSRELPSLEGNGYYVWQFYLRRALLNPDCLNTICKDFWHRFEATFLEEPFQLAGVEAAAVPMITAILLDGKRRGHNVNAFTIRKERKAYGKRNIIEGTPSDAPVLFVDDLSSPQHNAFWHGVSAIGSAQLRLYRKSYVVVLKRKDMRSEIIDTSIGATEMLSMFNLDDFSLTREEYENEKYNRQ